MSAASPTRRERLRAEAFADIRRHGYTQIASGGAAALSLNGIARAMGMSGAAMYRYFPSREALLSTLIIESYEDLAEHLSGAHEAARRRGPTGRFRAVAEAYRGWALAQPHRYRLVFESDLSTASPEPERIISAAQRAMDVILAAIAALELPATPISAGLARELRRWGAGTCLAEAEPSLYLAGQRTWSRLHGVISLEIEGVYAQMGIDPGALYAAEIAGLAPTR